MDNFEKLLDGAHFMVCKLFGDENTIYYRTKHSKELRIYS